MSSSKDCELKTGDTAYRDGNLQDIGSIIKEVIEGIKVCQEKIERMREVGNGRIN